MSHSLKTIGVLSLITITIACKEQKTNDSTQFIINEQPMNDIKESTWKLSWSEEFNENSLDEKTWNRQVVKAGRFNEEWQRYTADPKNAAVVDGKLEITALHEGNTHGMDQYTSARLNTAQKKSFTYGKLVSRIKLPQGEGLWPAFWMLGTDIDENGGTVPWPDCGEIDILELYGSKDDAVIEANAHFSGKDGTHDQMGAASYHLKEGIFADDYHNFELEWNENEMIWRVDETEFARMDITGEEHAEFHKEFFILLNIAVGGTWAGRPDESTVFPQKMYVDWIRYYQKT